MKIIISWCPSKIATENTRRLLVTVALEGTCSPDWLSKGAAMQLVKDVACLFRATMNKFREGRVGVAV